MQKLTHTHTEPSLECGEKVLSIRFYIDMKSATQPCSAPQSPWQPGRSGRGKEGRLPANQRPPSPLTLFITAITVTACQAPPAPAGLGRLRPQPWAASARHPGPSGVPVLRRGGRGVPDGRQIIVSGDVAVLGRVVVAGGRAERLGVLGAHGVRVWRQRRDSVRRRWLLPFSPLQPPPPEAELEPGCRAVCAASQPPVGGRGGGTLTCPLTGREDPVLAPCPAPHFSGDQLHTPWLHDCHVSPQPGEWVPPLGL